MKFTHEQVMQIKKTANIEELAALAKKEGVVASDEKLAEQFELYHQGGTLADEELDNVSGGSQCIDGKTYSSDYPYELITTVGNCCDGYENNKTAGLSSTCYTCKYHYRDGYFSASYCTLRTADNDPYR